MGHDSKNFETPMEDIKLKHDHFSTQTSIKSVLWCYLQDTLIDSAYHLCVRPVLTAVNEFISGVSSLHSSIKR